ncbi:hypothetical protein STANM309S_00217 [Streptomyces tanashiensis]
MCEWKGVATHWTLQGTAGHPPVPGAAWSYEEPRPGYEAIAGHIAFYPELVEGCTVDGERPGAAPAGGAIRRLDHGRGHGHVQGRARTLGW